MCSLAAALGLPEAQGRPALVLGSDREPMAAKPRRKPGAPTAIRPCSDKSSRGLGPACCPSSNPPTRAAAATRTLVIDLERARHKASRTHLSGHHTQQRTQPPVPAWQAAPTCSAPDPGLAADRAPWRASSFETSPGRILVQALDAVLRHDLKRDACYLYPDCCGSWCAARACAPRAWVEFHVLRKRIARMRATVRAGQGCSVMPI